MDLKIENEVLRLNSYKSTKSGSKSSNNSSPFGECLNNNINRIQKSFDLHEKENSSSEIKVALRKIEIALEMEITSKDYKDNGKLDIMGIIRKHGNKLSTRDVEDFKKAINTLWDNGVIDTEDYFEVIKWLSLQRVSNNIDSMSEDELFDIGDQNSRKN